MIERERGELCAAPLLSNSADAFVTTRRQRLFPSIRIITGLPAKLTDVWTPAAQAFGWIAAGGKPSATAGAIDDAQEDMESRLRSGDLVAYQADPRMLLPA